MSHGQHEVITPALRARMLELAPGAIERYQDFGRADRREGAIALLLAGAAPLAGLLLLRWEPAAVVVSLLLNLLFGLTDDIVSILRARGRSEQVQRERVEDEFVWPLADALARGRATLHARRMPREAHLAQVRSKNPLSGSAFLAYLMAAFALPLMYGHGAALGSGTMVVLGSAPSLLLTVTFGVLHGVNRHAAWRRAASVRLQTSAATAFFLFYLGLLVFFVAVLPQNPPLSERQLAVVASVATLGYGAWRVRTLYGMDFSLRVLKRKLSEFRQFGTPP